MEITPEDFLRLTTEGYPLELRHSKEEFYELFAKFVNESKENSFFGEVAEDGTKIHAGMRTEVCTVSYDEDRVVISTNIDTSDYASTSEFDADEEIKILGYACIGVIFFCDLYILGTGQNKRMVPRSNLSLKENKIKRPSKTTHDIWPI